MEDDKHKLVIGILALDKKFSDYLYEIRHLFDSDETPSVGAFIANVGTEDKANMVFIARRGVVLRKDIRREIIELYSDIFSG